MLITSLFALMSCTEAPKKAKIPLLQSNIKIDTIFSEILNEDRLLSIYLPKGYTSDKTYPVVYSTDGQEIIENYKSELDSLIENKIVREFLMVGVHSNEKLVEGSTYLNYRNYEYVKGQGAQTDSMLNKRFENHYDFFSKEVFSFVEMQYSVSKNKEERIFYGVSNGAGFGVTFGAENPEVFANYICYSMGGGDFEALNWTESNQPYYHIKYGDEEPLPFVMASKEFGEFLKTNNYQHSFSAYNGGHDRKMWKIEFLKVLPKIFKNK